MSACLEGRVALVTGGGSGIGRGIAQAYAREGANVAVADISGERAEESAEALRAHGVRSLALQADVGSRSACQDILARTDSELGGLDLLVNNAVAHFPLVPFQEVAEKDFERVFAVAARSTFWLMQGAYALMLARGGGSVLNLGSNAATVGFALHAAYAAAKEAIRGMSRVAAREWAPQGIRVNVICPIGDSEGMRSWAAAGGSAFDEFLAGIPMGRIGDCERDVGAAAVFLASEASRYVTGQTLWVDGGAGSVR